MTISRSQVAEWRQVQRDIGLAHRHFGRPFFDWHLFDAYMGTGKPDLLDIECWPEETRYGHDEVAISRTALRYSSMVQAMRREANRVGKRIYIGIFGHTGSTRDYYGPLYPEYNVTWEWWPITKEVTQP